MHVWQYWLMIERRYYSERSGVPYGPYRAGVTGNSVPPNFRSGGPTSLGNSVPPPPGPKSLDAQYQLNRTHFPRELSPPRTEIPVRNNYTLVHVHQKLARFDSV